jgi:hypothetical protein
MPVADFKVQLSVQPTRGGEAKFILPEVLQDLNYQFVIIKDGGEEGIIKIDEPDQVLHKVEQDEHCQRLTTEEMETLKKSYPAPKIKRKYRSRSQTHVAGEMAGEQFEVDAQGNRAMDVIQTIRSGFYLIDVPIMGEPNQE